MEDESPVLVERCAGYRVITLNRPKQLNAFNEAMHQALKRALSEAEEDSDCRALMLTGAGRAFCSGQDLRERISKDGKTTVLGSALETYYNPLVRKLRALPFPVVAAVNGVAAGIGATMLGHCDLVFVSSAARLRTPFPTLGVCPEAAPTSRSPATWCWRRARPASCRPSPRSAWCRIPAALGSCPAWSAPRARAGWR